jgi:glycosyltransferase involved in cell wall biosynthesis
MPETSVEFLEDHIVRKGKGWVEVNFNPSMIQSQTPLVSVSVTTYQHEDYIAQTLDSIISQTTDFPFEILLGEDCSNDDTRNICLDYARKYPQLIRLILHDRTEVIEINGRPTGRYNWLTNLQSARGTYLALCEGDDYWNDPSKLQKQVDFLANHQDYSLSYHDCCTVDPAGKTIQETLLGNRGRDLSQTDLIRGRRVPTLTAMFRRQDVLDLPPVFLGVLNADTFIFAHLGQKGAGKFQSEIQPAAYRIHSGGIWSSATVLKKAEDLIGTFRGIVASTDPAFRSAARSELKSKYALKLLACVRYCQFGEIAATCRHCVQDLGWVSMPGLLTRSCAQLCSRFGRRLLWRR